MNRIFHHVPILAALLGISGCASAPVTHGIPNFAQVEPGVWRGGQPTDAGWEWLRSQGVQWDEKLNTWDESPEPKIFTGTPPIWIVTDPISLDEQFFGVNGYKVDSAVQTLIDHRKDGVFVHCQHGEDRTGLVVAVYRVRVDGWSKADAESEMLAHGFHKELFGLWHYWRELPEK